MPDRQPPKPSARATGRTSFAKSELERAKEPVNKSRTSFSATELSRESAQGDAPLRDQDNTQMRPKPRAITLDHPRMAPPGMSGIKTYDRTNGLARSDKRPSLKKEPSDARREFKELGSGHAKDRSFER